MVIKYHEIKYTCFTSLLECHQLKYGKLKLNLLPAKPQTMFSYVRSCLKVDGIMLAVVGVEFR